MNDQKFAIKWPLPPVECDLLEEIQRATLECYRTAVTAGLYPVERPKVTFVPGNLFPTSYQMDRPVLHVSVRCSR